ncbi:Do family serine endopeptidase [bacterium]|nr:Do family serine endopeptidase [bacterium]
MRKKRAQERGYSIFSHRSISLSRYRLFLCILAFILIPLIGLSLSHAADAGAENYPNRETPVVLAVKKVGPAVVNISTERIMKERINPFGDPFFDQFFRDFFNAFPQRSYKQQSLGSGVIINPEGYILTNEHVILKTSQIIVTLADKREFEAKLIGADTKSDLAIIKIDDKEPLPHVTMGKSDDLMIGETVIAIGNPFGLSHTVTTGVISALNRSVKVKEDRIYKDFIQTDASINPGNSGGPLLNILGELIGINTAIYQEAEGIGFAIPINRAKRIIKDLIHYGEVRKAWTGIYVQELDQNLLKHFDLSIKEGVIVTKVMEGSPAEKSGIKQGDIIINMGGQAISTWEDYISIISGYTSGDRITFSIIRDDKKINIEVTASDIPIELAESLAFNWLGIRYRKITQNDFLKYGIKDKRGIIVTEVVRMKAADRAGIRPGDIIRQVNNQVIEEEETFKKAILAAAQQESLLLMVQRGPYIYPVTLQP